MSRSCVTIICKTAPINKAQATVVFWSNYILKPSTKSRRKAPFRMSLPANEKFLLCMSRIDTLASNFCSKCQFVLKFGRIVYYVVVSELKWFLTTHVGELSVAHTR
jgi:hypothetical protein